MATLTNPILKGFNPDPSILCVGDDFYIATSTFEWYPGVSIYHSKNLIDWKLVCRPLATTEFLNMEGNVASGGVWAPCLSYDEKDGYFYLAFTDVKTWDESVFKDVPNYLTRTKDLLGEWEKPKFINGSGFDPSVFHDDDGRKWFVNLQWDYRREDPKSFDGIIIQELDAETLELIGPIYNIFMGTGLDWTEGAHIYKKDGYYYLTVAEGGTIYNHVMTVCRSKNLFGPYEVHPQMHLVTSKFDYTQELQKAGHGSLCKGNDGKWWVAFLCARPIPNTKRCILGRETAIAEVIWKDGWPYLLDETVNPPVNVDVPYERDDCISESKSYTFDNRKFLDDFQTLRIPMKDSMFQIVEDKLRIIGKQSIASRHTQSIICRRQQHFKFEVETALTFETKDFQKMAGLIYRYNERNQYFFRLSYDNNTNKNVIGIIEIDQGNLRVIDDTEVDLVKNKIWLKADVDYSHLIFSYSLDGDSWVKLGNVLDASILSDEYDSQGFTGAFVGMACVDTRDYKAYAEFDYFKYIAR